MSNADLLRVAAHHLLAAARPSNPNPTPSTLAAALAMSQAGLRVELVREGVVLLIPRGRAAVAPSTLQPGAVRVARYLDGAVIDDEEGVYDNADALTAALRALLEDR